MAAFSPSPYQQAIFDFIANDTRDLFVSAYAGSGKTTVLVQASNRLPEHLRQSALFVAFNKAIAEELGTRLPSGVKSSTIHSQGYGALRAFLNPPTPNNWIYDGKYKKLVEYWFRSQGVPVGFRASKEVQDEINAITDLLGKAQLTLTDPCNLSALQLLAARFDIAIGANPLQAADEQWERAQTCIKLALQWGVDGVPYPEGGRTYAAKECISYNDMVYLPNVLRGLAPKKYKVLFVDECQDLNAAQFGLLQMCRDRGGRMIFVGDERQAIYGFSGADTESIQTIQRTTGAVKLPLSICYRCPSSHLELARKIVPEIEVAPDAYAGVVGDIREDELSKHVQKEIAGEVRGSLVLCRCNAPLIGMAFRLITEGIPCKVRGKDIGKALTQVIDTIEKFEGYAFPEFLNLLETYRQRMTFTLSRQEGTELQIEAVNDKVDSVRAVYTYVSARRTISDAGELRAEIENLFSDDENIKVILSTVHKAKGLEAERVFILKPQLLPHPKASRGWEVLQEENLRYVALTRAMVSLFFVHE